MHGLRWVGFALCGWVSVAGVARGAGAQAGNPGNAVSPGYPGGGETPLGQAIGAVLADAVVARAHWGVAVTALDGTPLYGLNEGQMFRPASNAKLFTTTAAMALLGAGATVMTTVDFAPPGHDGTVAGAVTMVGHGDANLSGRVFPYAEPGAAAVAGAVGTGAAGTGAAGTGTVGMGTVGTGAVGTGAVGTVQAAGAGQAGQPLRVIDEFADGMVKAGVRRVTGGLVASDWPWEPYPQGWGTDDLLWGYGAPVATLGIDDNEVRVTVTAGAMFQPAVVTLTPDVGYYRIESTARTTDEASAAIAIDREPGERTLHVRGLVRAGRPYSAEIAVDDPPLYALYALRSELEARGVRVEGKLVATKEFSGNPDDFLHESREPVLLPPQGGRVAGVGDCAGECPARTVLSHTSPTLAEDVIATLKESLNLHAELMLRRLGERFGNSFDSNSGAFAQGARVERQWLIDAGLDANDFVFYDGSGLSAKDLVTPRATARLLSFATRQPWFAQWKAALPVGGVDGTLRGRFTDPAGYAGPPLKGRVFAKTGTLGESSALSGYMDCASGREVIFSIFSDDHLPGSAANRAAMDKIVAAIAANE